MFGHSDVRPLVGACRHLCCSREAKVPLPCSVTWEGLGLELSRKRVCMKQLSLTTGVVQGGILTYQQEGGQVRAVVGSAAWFRWLEQATSFTFRDEPGHFTAQKTHAGNQRGGSYWRARRRRHGRLASYYLGTSARLSLEHLRQAAQALAAP